MNVLKPNHYKIKSDVCKLMQSVVLSSKSSGGETMTLKLICVPLMVCAGSRVGEINGIDHIGHYHWKVCEK